MDLLNIKNVNDLGVLLGEKPSKITYFAFIAPNSKKYRSFKIKKRQRGYREIYSPNKGLKEIQRKMLSEISKYYNPRSSVHGFIEGKSFITNASVHSNQRWVARIDLKDFFPSIHIGRVIGLFRSKLFNLSKDISVLLAKLCTYDGILPQGAPTSPIITNLICRGIDYRLSELAVLNKCYYSRYADDIFFSTNKRHFPSDILYKDSSDTIRIGEKLDDVIYEADFTVNLQKLSLKDKSNRQIATGVVINEKPNLPKEYVRELRAMIYAWKKHGLGKAEAYWRNHYDKRNRVNPNPPKYRWVLRGKLEHLGNVKGRLDPVYLNLAAKLAEVDESFTVDSKKVSLSVASEIKVFTEGKTDIMHLESALEYFQRSGEYTNLHLSFEKNNLGVGDTNLLKLCKSLCSTLQNKLTILVFDKDNESVTKQVSGSTKDYYDWKNNVYSIAIPIPSHRSEEKVCIEHYYKDDHMKLKDTHGRRLFTRDEFDKQSGCHNSESGLVLLYPAQNSLIVDSNVTDVANKNNVALSKADFAIKISKKEGPFDKMDFSEFSKIFDLFNEIYSGYSSSE